MFINREFFLGLCLDCASTSMIEGNTTNLESIESLLKQLYYLRSQLSKKRFDALCIRLKNETVYMPTYIIGCGNLYHHIKTQRPTPARNQHVRNAVSIVYKQLAHQLC